MGEKTTNRRDFLKTSGAAALTIGIGLPMLSACSGKASGEGEGPRWAMVVNRSRCPEDCNECSKACHLTHNVPTEGLNITSDLPEDERLKWIWKEEFLHAFPNVEHEYMEKGVLHEPTIVFCNHCENPPCVKVCPTQSTWRREDGVVMMDMHRCIGCRYCIVGCPYGSRSFNWRDPRRHLDPDKLNPDFPTRTKGVVEKCNFCAERLTPERLAKGEKPACVEACHQAGHDALTYGDIKDEGSDVRRLLEENVTIRRKAALGTGPHVFYLVGGDDA